MIAAVACFLAFGCTGSPAGVADSASERPAVTSSGGGSSPAAQPPGEDPVAEQSEEPRARAPRTGWTLREVTADGTQVALTVFHGACDGYVGPVVTEDTPEEVEIRIAYDPPGGALECNDVGFAKFEVVDLPTPLADRELRGCDAMGTRQIPESGADVEMPGAIAAAAGVVVTTVAEGIVGLDAATGQEVWRIPHDPDVSGFLEEPTALGDAILFIDQSATNDVLAVDAATGEVRWEAQGRNWFDVLSSQVAASGELVLLTPRQAQASAGPTEGMVEARSADGSVAWATAVDGQVFQTSMTDGMAVVVSGRTQDGQQLGRTVLTALDTADGTPRWSVELPGQPFGVVARPDDDILVVDVLGATYGLRMSDGAQVWRNLPLNYGGINDVGPSVMLSPGRYGDPFLLVDPRTGDAVGEVDRSDDLYLLDVRRYARLDDHTIVAGDGLLTRRDVSDVPLTQPDPSPTWTAELLAAAGPTTLTNQGSVIVPTPLGARAFDVETGELLWAFADG